MAYYVKYRCGSCKYFEWDGTDDTRGYCAWYKACYYPSDSCNHWDD